MKLLRSELKSEFNKKLFDMSARELPDRGTIFHDDQITCELSAKIVQFGFQLSGVIKTIANYQCVRCLCYKPKEILSGDDDQDMVHFPKNIDHIDMIDTIADIIRLAEPMSPKCNDNCKGLCPNCGINLNQSSCDCKLDSHDSHWDILKTY